MKITRTDLENAANRGLITSAQAGALWSALEERDETLPGFGLGNVLFYFGGLIVISSISWFVVDAWERLGGAGIFAIAFGYGIAFLAAGRFLWNRKSGKIPGGILFTAAVATVPLAVYGIERMLGWWPMENPGTYARYYTHIHGSWILLELSTFLAGLLVLRFVKFSFVTFPMALAIWFLSMDLTPLLLQSGELDMTERKWVSIIVGIAMLIVSYFADRRSKVDYSAWGYIFGLLAFWGGLSLLDSTNEFGKFIYCLINVGLIFLSVFLDRRAFIVFGAIGVFVYLGHLVNTVFKDQIAFPFVLSLFGAIVIGLGLWYQKNRGSVEAWMLASTPRSLQNLRPTAR